MRDERMEHMAARWYGERDNILKTIEECGELIRALSRYLSDAEPMAVVDNVHEEIADVEIMIRRMRMIFDADEIDDWMDSKLDRLAATMTKEMAALGVYGDRLPVELTPEGWMRRAQAADQD